ncbi:hypothetical protein AVEN_261678-1 [Araneus ventricosus]|uniref:Uncharacterized protein n=1 Tax=Araneus ventricosus TaxID=182803 RepID=A0A4Y2DWV6_ARAVE|nr:hypothetical protein AVEN_261678-1 [Araneus ventricosus]
MISEHIQRNNDRRLQRQHCRTKRSIKFLSWTGVLFRFNIFQNRPSVAISLTKQSVGLSISAGRLHKRGFCFCWMFQNVGRSGQKSCSVFSSSSPDRDPRLTAMPFPWFSFSAQNFLVLEGF